MNLKTLPKKLLCACKQGWKALSAACLRGWKALVRTALPLWQTCRAYLGQMPTQKLLYWLAGGVLALVVLVAVICAANQPPAPQIQTIPVSGTVGVSLSGPAGSSLPGQMAQALEAQGLQPTVLCADGNAATQKGQIQALLGINVSCLIIQPIDSLMLTQLLTEAKEKNIPVIACDAMLMDTDWVWGCVSFDYFTLGKLMARKIAEEKQLDTQDNKSYKLELFMGAPENNSSLLLYLGAMEVFTPYLRSGKLTIPSGCTSFEDTYTGGTTQNAMEMCALRLKKSKPDIVFAASDEIAAGCKQALLNKGYKLENFPTLIGQGGSNAQAVKEGYQIATYAKAPILLAESCAEAAVWALSGKQLPDKSTQYNHVLDVPTKLLPTSLVDS